MFLRMLRVQRCRHETSGVADGGGGVAGRGRRYSRQGKLHRVRLLKAWRCLGAGSGPEEWVGCGGVLAVVRVWLQGCEVWGCSCRAQQGTWPGGHLRFPSPPPSCRSGQEGIGKDRPLRWWWEVLGGVGHTMWGSPALSNQWVLGVS